LSLGNLCATGAVADANELTEGSPRVSRRFTAI
jgi:hypothetical protein